MKNLILISLLAVAVVGCKSSNLSEVIGQLKDDHSTFDLTLITPWGQQTIHRSNPYPPYVTNAAPVALPAAK